MKEEGRLPAFVTLSPPHLVTLSLLRWLGRCVTLQPLVQRLGHLVDGGAHQLDGLGDDLLVAGAAGGVEVGDGAVEAVKRLAELRVVVVAVERQPPQRVAGGAGRCRSSARGPGRRKRRTAACGEFSTTRGCWRCTPVGLGPNKIGRILARSAKACWAGRGALRRCGRQRVGGRRTPPRLPSSSTGAGSTLDGRRAG